MPRYIDADKLIKFFPDDGDGNWTYNVTAQSYINIQPTADVIPIEWIKEQKDKCFPDSITGITLNELLAEWERREDGKV